MSKIDDTNEKSVEERVIELEQLLETITNWHRTALAGMDEILDLDEGTELSLNLITLSSDEPESEKIILTGDVHKAFIFGALSGLSKFRNIPTQADLNLGNTSGKQLSDYPDPIHKVLH